MTTRSVDPAGMHELNHPGNSKKGPLHPDYWHQHQYFSVPEGMEEWDLIRLQHDTSWMIVAGSDLILQCELLTNRAINHQAYCVLAYDGSGNVLAKLGEFITAPAALQALPSLLAIAHMLYPNHLLMPIRAEHSEFTT